MVHRRPSGEPETIFPVMRMDESILFPGTQLMDVLFFLRSVIYSTFRKRRPLTRNEVHPAYLGHLQRHPGGDGNKVERVHAGDGHAKVQKLSTVG